LHGTVHRIITDAKGPVSREEFIKSIVDKRKLPQKQPGKGHDDDMGM
jgi:hypothetical protein